MSLKIINFYKITLWLNRDWIELNDFIYIKWFHTTTCSHLERFRCPPEDENWVIATQNQITSKEQPIIVRG